MFARAESATPFNTWLWMSTWWDLFGQGKALRVFVVRDGDQTIAIAPFYAMIYRLGPMRLRILLPCGEGNDLTERIEMLVASSRRSDAIGQLASYLSSRRSRLWDLMMWTGVERCELPSMLRDLVCRDYQIPYEVRSLPGSWTEFVTGLNKSMRDNIKYYPRLLAHHGHAVRTHVASTPQEIVPAIGEFLRLHHARAHLKHIPHHDDRFGEPLHQQFLHRVAPALAEAGMLRIALLAVDGINVASQITLEHAGTLYVYYSGFDPAWQQYSVGMIVTANCIQDATERGLREMDLLSGTGQFKRRWDTKNMPHARLILLRDSVLPVTAFTAYRFLHHMFVDRFLLEPYHGINPRNRLLGWIGRVLKQPSA